MVSYGRSFALAFLVGAGVGVACSTTGADGCTVGSQGCTCTVGGGCDPNLTCIDGMCVHISGDTGGSADGGPAGVDDDPSAPGDDGVDDGGTRGTTDGGSIGEDSTGSSIKLDVAVPDVPGGACARMGCQAVDMLFALDSSLSMTEEIEALSSTSAFAAIIDTIEAINCGDIDYRIGLTNDNDGGWIGWNDVPWFDSQRMTPQEIADAFSSAAGTVLGNGGTAIGCEHVLSSSRGLLVGDTTGFVRPEALLVLVLVTDVDDYGAYDQQGFGGPCNGFLCTEPSEPVPDILADLVALKGGDDTGLATIVVAGDPNVTEGMNLCQQPASCCGVDMVECGQALHAERLWDFASMLPGTNGVTVDICQGADQLPTAIESALGTDIDLACQTYEPAG